MARISAARKLILSKLAAATTTAESTQLAAQLNRLIEQEERKAGRTRRSRAKKAAPRRNDDDEPFEVEPAPKPRPTPKPSPADIERRRKVRADLRAMGEVIPWDRDIDGVPPEELPPPEDHATRCIREHAERKRQDALANGNSCEIAAFAFPAPHDPTPQSSVGLAPGQDWIPIEADVIESNAYNAEEGWSWRAFDSATGDYYNTNEKIEAQREEQARQQRTIEDRIWGVR